MGSNSHPVEVSFKQLISIFLIVTGLSLMTACSEYLPISFGPLSGTVEPIPETWQAVADIDIIQFETVGDAPYSVNLWVVEIAGDLHVFAGDNLATWVTNIAKNPMVRLGAEEQIYELKADRVTDPDVFEEFAQAWEAKYGNRPRNENVDETYLYRLTAR